MKKFKQLFFVVQVFCIVVQNVQASTYTGIGNSSLPFTCAAENSCKNQARCGAVLETQRGENSPPKCYCDSHCSSLNDCCADHQLSCQTNNQTNKIANTHLITNTWQCYQYSKTPRSPGIWMIATCPANYTGNPVSRMMCEDAANRALTSLSVDFLSNVPTTHCYKLGGCVTFRNYYCAQCNGVLAPIFWKLIWRCNISPPKHLNKTDRDKFLSDYCPDFRLEPHDRTSRRYCYGVVSNCSVKVDSLIKDDCIRGHARLVYHPKTDKHYRNPSCLTCNGLKLEDSKCGPSEFSSQVFQPKSFEMVLQFEKHPWDKGLKSTRTTHTSCGKEMVYDTFLEECRQGVLPDPVQSIVDKFRFKMWLKPVSLDSLIIDRNVFKRAILEQFSLPSCGVSVISVKKEEKSIAAIFDAQAISTNNSFNDSSSAFGLKSLLYFSDAFELLIQGKAWNVFKVTHKRLACSKPKIYPPDNFTRFNESSFLVNNETFVAVEDGQIIARNHSEKDIQAGSLFVCRSFFTEICNSSQVLLALREGDYTLVNDTVYFKAAGQTFSVGSYELQGTTAWVCTDYKNHTNSKLKDDAQTKWRNNEVLWYFTVCGFSLSIISLVFLLGTYVCFKELRTLPGKNMMSLSLSLILSEFMWLLGSGDTDNPGFCKTTAFLLHYLFLASFACMTVIAHDTRRAFPKNHVQMSSHLFPSSQRRLMTYLIFSWGLPLVFVVTCFLLDQQGAVAIGYGNPVICWLTDLKAQIIIFGVPVGVMLLYNLVAFVQTVQSIRVARIGSKTLHRQGGNHGNDCKIYLRLMSLMGFTWFFGFGAHALHESLMYVFVLLTSLQGVYLAVAFAVKPYVFNLYRNRWANFSISRKTTISTLDLTTSMKSTPSRSAESVV